MSRITLDTPYVETKVTTYTEFEIRSICVNLETPSAEFIVVIYSNEEVDVKQFTMDGTDYTNWGLDNAYAIAFIKSKLAAL